MEFGLSEEQKLLIGTVKRFVETELMPLEEEVEAPGRFASVENLTGNSETEH